MEEIRRRVISILVANNAGVLNKVAGLFARRAYNIDSLSVGETENPDTSRMTIVVHADDLTLEQIKNQLAKLIDVIEITVLRTAAAVLREHVLVHVETDGHRADIMFVVDTFRGNVVDISQNALIAELTGSPSKISAFIKNLKPFGIKSLVRTGVTGLQRGDTM
ncbi:MAG: acetolactate synthase small subunit [Oscillospiraceae bacterium]|nr:acetolactate synthase small subunit [Oscillospiraceae bacterium]